MTDTKTKRFLVTLKSSIKVQQLRADRTPLLLKTQTLLVDWPLVMGSDSKGLNPDLWIPAEAPRIDVDVVGFVADDYADKTFWESPFRQSGCEPFKLELKRDNILARQEIDDPPETIHLP